MSNIKFGTFSNSILLASSFTGPTAFSNYPVSNLTGFNRGAHFRRSAQGTSSTFSLDMGASATLNPNFLIVARADILRSSDSAAVSISFDADDNSGFTSPETNALSLDTSNLTGRTVQDAYYSVTFTTAYRYLRAVVTTTQSSYHEFSKLVFGSWFDFGREPLIDSDITQKDRISDNYHSRHEYKLRFKGVSNTKRTEFYQLIDRHRNTKPLFIYDEDDVLLDGYKIAQVRLVRADYSINFYESEISLVLEEVY